MQHVRHDGLSPDAAAAPRRARSPRPWHSCAWVGGASSHTGRVAGAFLLTNAVRRPSPCAQQNHQHHAALIDPTKALVASSGRENARARAGARPSHPCASHSPVQTAGDGVQVERGVPRRTLLEDPRARCPCPFHVKQRDRDAFGLGTLSARSPRVRYRIARRRYLVCWSMRPQWDVHGAVGWMGWLAGREKLPLALSNARLRTQ
jgi:hypothetical protein